MKKPERRLNCIYKPRAEAKTFAEKEPVDIGKTITWVGEEPSEQSMFLEAEKGIKAHSPSLVVVSISLCFQGALAFFKN